MTKFILFGGHGAGPAHNRGGLCYNEGDNNYLQTVALKEELERYENADVTLGRAKITDNPPLAKRSAETKGYDLAIMCHSNAAGASVRGTEVFDSVEKPNIQLANAICTVLSRSFNHPNRGVKYKVGQPGYNWYGELRHHGAKSAMIVEAGFHTNAQDCKYAKENHKHIARIVANEIAYFYKLKLKSARPPLVDKPKHEVTNKVYAEAWDWSTNTGLLDGTYPERALTREQYALLKYREGRK